MQVMLVEGGRMWQQVAEGDGDDVDKDKDASQADQTNHVPNGTPGLFPPTLLHP